MVNYTKPETTKRMCDRETNISLQQSISKDDHGKLGTINMSLFCISLTMVTLSADCYCGTLSLQQLFFAKVLGNFAKVSSFCMKMPGDTPNWTAVYGCTSDMFLRSVFYLTESLRSTWLASDCNRC